MRFWAEALETVKNIVFYRSKALRFGLRLRVEALKAVKNKCFLLFKSFEVRFEVVG